MSSMSMSSSLSRMALASRLAPIRLQTTAASTGQVANSADASVAVAAAAAASASDAAAAAATTFATSANAAPALAAAVGQAQGPVLKSAAPTHMSKLFELPTSAANSASASTTSTSLLHPKTEIISVGRLPLVSVPQYEDRANAWWKYPFVQSWLHAFNTGAFAGLVELSRDVFGQPVRSDVIAQVLEYERNWREQGTESSKTRGQVRGSTRKAFQQKGRGKARVGTIRAPQFVGGYTVHGPHPHNKATDIPRKVYNLGIRTALSTKFAQDQLLVVDLLAAPNASKAEMRDRLRRLGISGRKTCFFYGASQPSLALIEALDSFEVANPTEDVPEGERKQLVAAAEHVSVSALMEYEMVVLDKEAVEVLEELYRTEMAAH
ncbi:ribosomal protein L4 domain-containing protein [Entophlyctis helioformis]|nr:ribosomal protein L4 domain-containing protein [Entophlyctis helioformis]